MIRNNWRYLTEAPNYPGNSWRCDPEKDAFIHIRAQGEKGEVGVCSELRTGLGTDEIDLSSAEWRRKKRELVEKCQGCLYSCFYESENQDFKGDLRTYINMILIKFGQAGIVRRLGERAVGERSDLISVPQSKLEEMQAEIQEDFKIHNRIKKRGLDLIHILEIPFLYAYVLTVLGIIYLQAARKKISPDEVLRAMLTGIVYPGVLESGKEEKKSR